MRLLKAVRSLDIRVLLVVLLIGVSTGHVGAMFADRESVRQSFVGYALAIALDGVLVLALYESVRFRKRSHRAFALFVFVFACECSFSPVALSKDTKEASTGGVAPNKI